MTVYLVGARSVHATAAACDYLADAAGPDDAVVVCAVDEGDGEGARDGADAANVARVRLVEPRVTVDERSGDPAAVLRAAAADHGADALVVGAGGDPGGGLGPTTRALLDDAARPVVVVPAAG